MTYTHEQCDGTTSVVVDKREYDEIVAALRFHAEACEQVAALQTCGERAFLTGMAKAMRAVLAKVDKGE